MSLLHSLSNSDCHTSIERDVCSESRTGGCCTSEHMLGVASICGSECRASNTHLNVDTKTYNTDSFSYIPGRPDRELCFVENYFDDNSVCFRRESVSLQNLAPSGVAIGAAEVSEMEDVGGVTEIVATLSTMSARSVSGILAAGGAASNDCFGTNNTGGVNIVNCEEDDDNEEDDDGSHFGTSMLQNRKKPRSRLKKFLTSLLSLSSSSSDDENYDIRSAPSQPSNW